VHTIRHALDCKRWTTSLLSAAKGEALHTAGEVWYLRLPCLFLNASAELGLPASSLFFTALFGSCIIARYWLKNAVFIPHVCVIGDLTGISSGSLAWEHLNSIYSCSIIIRRWVLGDWLICFHTIPACDGQTERMFRDRRVAHTALYICVDMHRAVKTMLRHKPKTHSCSGDTFSYITVHYIT